jgi:hypothetical protein
VARPSLVHIKLIRLAATQQWRRGGLAEEGRLASTVGIHLGAYYWWSFMEGVRVWCSEQWNAWGGLPTMGTIGTHRIPRCGSSSTAEPLSVVGLWFCATILGKNSSMLLTWPSTSGKAYLWSNFGTGGWNAVHGVDAPPCRLTASPSLAAVFSRIGRMGANCGIINRGLRLGDQVTIQVI